MLVFRCTLIRLVITGFCLGLTHQKKQPGVNNEYESVQLNEDGKVPVPDGLLAVDESRSENENCGLTFDAATNFRDELYFFKGSKFWRVRANSQVFKETEIRHLWSGFPANLSTVDAVFTIPEDQSIVFISEHYYWRISDPREKPTKQPLSALGVSGREKIRAAYVWDVNEGIYLIGTKNYWKLSQDLKLEIGYPKKLKMIKGLPSDLDGAFEDFHRQVYFMQGRKAWKLNNDKHEVARNNFTSISTRWLGCTPTSRDGSGGTNATLSNIVGTRAVANNVASTTATASNAFGTTGAAAKKRSNVLIFGFAILLTRIYVASTSD